jgi:hypothetical protein
MIRALLATLQIVAYAQTPDDVLKPQVQNVMRCYTDIMKDNLRAAVSPTLYENTIRKACALQEEELKVLAKASLPAELNRDDQFVAKLRERSVIGYFNVLQRLVPKYAGRCPSKDYRCIIQLDESSKKTPH